MVDSYQELHTPSFDLENHQADSAFIHESSYVDAPCQIGEHTTILPFAHVMSNSIIGNHCLIGHHATVASGVLLGNNVRVMHSALLNSGVIMEDDVYCGPSTVFVEGRRARAKTDQISRISPTVVRMGANIGPHSTVVSGSILGRYCFIEAGTVVDRNVPDFAVVYGNPLKFGGWQCECGKPISFREEITQCKHCERVYSRKTKWKVLQLKEGIWNVDTDTQFDPSVRTAQNQD